MPMVACYRPVQDVAVRSDNLNDNWGRLLLISTIIGLLIRAFIIVQPIETILCRFGSDDLFYYTEIAKNVVAGNGVSFDGINVTSGFQPLWLILLVPFAAFFESPEIALRVVLALTSIASVLVAWMFPRLLGRLMSEEGKMLGAVAGSIWMLHPKILSVTFEGTESSLAALAWLTSLWVWSSSTQKSRNLTLGFVLGVGTLARIDHLVLAGVLWLFPLAQPWHLLKKGLQFLPGITLTFGSWLLVNWFVTGSFAIDSGSVKRLHAERYFAIQNGLAFDQVNAGTFILHQPLELLKSGVRYLSWLVHAESKLSVLLMLAMAVGSSMIAWQVIVKRAKLQTVLPLSLKVLDKLKPLLIAAIMVFLAYLIHLGHMRSWYLIPLYLAVVIFSASVLIDLVSSIVSRASIRKVSYALLLFFGLLHVEAHLLPRKGFGPEYFAAMDRVRKKLPAGTRIGAFNAGIPGAWLSPDIEVVNLDGVVNHSVGNALEERGLDRYVKENEVGYLFDLDGSIGFFGKIGAQDSSWRLEPKFEIQVNGTDSLSIGLWEVK